MAARKQRSVEDRVSASLAAMQEEADEAKQKGYRGERVDETPFSAYTLRGVLAGEPTPETEPEPDKPAE